MNSIINKYLIEKFTKTIFHVLLVFFSLGVILNLLEEIEFFTNYTTDNSIIILYSYSNFRIAAFYSFFIINDLFFTLKIFERFIVNKSFWLLKHKNNFNFIFFFFFCGFGLPICYKSDYFYTDKIL